MHELREDRTWFGDGLATLGTRPALIDGDLVVTYAELDERVEAVRAQLGARRRLLLVEAGNDVGSVVAYLAALRGGHPAMIVPPGPSSVGGRLYDRYDPDVVLAGSGSAPSIVERREGSAHDLHPDLALLLSTSGTTGSPRLVRLSRTNLDANAAAITSYLALDGDDVTQTTLPLHYCYGLSVVNSHLRAGAAIALSRSSVTDPCFWAAARANGTTNFAGVPHTFELLDHSEFAERDLPSLRFITQAGGRLDPDTVRRFADLGAVRGWQLFVMYGQTEATARMAYLPPALARSHPRSIGIPVPGGAFRLDAPDEQGIGELVYEGPNVMLGYASAPDELALGRTVHELRTGDLARRDAHGLYEIVGRRSRFLKLFGLRVDLDGLEQDLAAAGHDTWCTGDDRRLVVGVRSDAPAAAAAVLELTGLPSPAVHVVPVAEVPRLASGKVDYPALLHRCVASTPDAPRDVRAVIAELLHVRPGDIADTDTFVSLGGDSLTYVEATVRLQAQLGTLPPAWHLTPIGELAPRPVPSPPALDTSLVLRAVGILAVVVSHATALDVRGGAHLLLAVTGFNFARFQLAGVRSSDRVRPLARSIARVAVPSLVAVALLHDGVGLRLAELLFVSTLTGAPAGRGQWHLWYLEVLVQLLALAAVLLLSRRVRAAERRHPLGFACAVVGVGLLLRVDLLPLPDGAHPRFQVHNVLWLFALGWAAERCSTRSSRIALTGTAAIALHGFFASDTANVVVLAGFVVLAWLPHLPVPTLLHRPLGAVAGASLLVYLTHWEVLRRLDGAPAVVTIGAALATGIAATVMHRDGPQVAQRLLRSARKGNRSRVARTTAGSTSAATTASSPDAVASTSPIGSTTQLSPS